MADEGADAPLAAGLYVVATPIGNLGDLSPRAREILARADLVACEDTRFSGRLLNRFGIATPRLSYHDHNAPRQRPVLLARIKAGAAVALITDAGTPLVSDPGYKLVRAVQDAGLGVYAVPGPSALTAALSVSGIPTDHFYFAGFLPSRRAARQKALAALAAYDCTLVIYESPARLAAALADMAVAFGGREAAVARELTKLHEEVRRAPIGTLAAAYADAPPPRGEIVVLIGPAPAAREAMSEADIDRALTVALAEGPTAGAATRVAGLSGRPRRQIYARAVALKKAAAKGDGG